MTSRMLVLGLTALLVLIECSCRLSDQPMFLEYRRPANVPPDATLVDQAKGGLWERCVYDPQKSANRCEVYNWRGGVLYNDEFLPYDGGAPVQPNELKISKYAPLAGPDAICLQNGRILLPKSGYERAKKHLDWIAGKRSSPS